MGRFGVLAAFTSAISWPRWFVRRHDDRDDGDDEAINIAINRADRRKAQSSPRSFATDSLVAVLATFVVLSVAFAIIVANVS